MLTAQQQIFADIDRIRAMLRTFEYAELVGHSDDDVRQSLDAVDRLYAIANVSTQAPDDLKDLSADIAAALGAPALRALRRMLSAAIKTRGTAAN